MRIFAAAALALSVAAALAQGTSSRGRPAHGAADGGPPRVRTPGPILLGTDPPGKLRRATAPSDAGAPVPHIAPPEDVQREMQQLKARVDALERERTQLAQQQSQQLEEVVRQLRDLRAQIADGEQRRQTAAQQKETQYEQLQAGVSALQQAQDMLAGGDYSVEGQLGQALAAFPPQAQRDVETARIALRNRDLSAARAYLSAAIAHAQQGR
jgi:TolA-binding protein